MARRQFFALAFHLFVERVGLPPSVLDVAGLRFPSRSGRKWVSLIDEERFHIIHVAVHQEEVV